MSATSRPVLIVADEQIAGDVAEAVVAEVRRAPVYLVCPALASSGLKHTLGDIDDAISAAEKRLKDSLETLSARRPRCQRSGR